MSTFSSTNTSSSGSSADAGAGSAGAGAGSAAASSGGWGRATKKDKAGGFGSAGTGGLFSTSPPLFQLTKTSSSSLPTDVAALQSIINTLQAEVKATNSVNIHLAASVARLQAEQATSTPATITTTPATVPCLHPDHPCTIASGRGAASPEIFKQMSKTNWHGRLGRAHMVDVDVMTTAKLMELDSLVRRKLQSIFPHGSMHSNSSNIETDYIFFCLASLGLRLEDRPRYVGFPILSGDKLVEDGTDKRARHLSAYFYANKTFQNLWHWHGALLETLIELARYRGLFDEDGFVKEE